MMISPESAYPQPRAALCFLNPAGKSGAGKITLPKS